MNEVRQLWAKRYRGYMDEAMRYWKLIGNSGLLFTVYFLIIVGGYYYQQFLTWLPEDFPVEWAFIILFTFIVTKASIRSFVKEGDLVFLLAMEGKLEPYIKRSVTYSFIIQSSVIVIFFMLLSPLFFNRIDHSGRLFFTTIVIVLVVKLWNIICKWEEQRFNSNGDRFRHMILIRFLINSVFLYLLFNQAHVMYIIVLLVIMASVYQFYYRKIKLRHGLKWEYLLEVEDRMLHTFYRFANFFTDVPKLKESVKERRYLNSLFQFVSFQKKNTFTYLYLRSFVRANDYFGLYVRLFVIGAVFLYVVPFGILNFFVYIAFILLSGIQLSTLQHHYRLKLWTDLYPIPLEYRKRSFSLVLFILLTVKAALFSIFIAGMMKSITMVLIYFILGIIFSYIFAFFLVYMKRKKGVLVE